MDHAINSLEPYYDVQLRIVAEEYGSGKYKKISDCPSYEELKVLVDAINTMRKYMGWGRINIRAEVNEYWNDRKIEINSNWGGGIL